LSNKKAWYRVFAAVVAVMLVAAACGGGDDDDGDAAPGGEEETEELQSGGTLRIAGTSDVDFMDPAAAYYTLSSTLMRGTMRQLNTYPNVADLDAQNELVGDLATDAGTPNEDNTVWSYTLKDGVMFGPALGGEEIEGVTGEEIVCDDIKYGLERIYIPSVGGGYPFFYDVLEGSQEFASGDADEITGIVCPDGPDGKAIEFNLSEPTGDWPYRVAMPAVSPVPREYAEQFDKKKDSDYDNHVVASGPYFVANWEPEELIELERNPHWDSATDEVRPAYVDAVEWKLGFENDVGVQQVQDGDYHIGLDVNPQGPALEQWTQDPDLSQRLLNEPSQCTRYVFLNTTIEPFDNQQVREAVNFAIDRANIKRLQGGETTGPIATSIVPPGMGGHLPSTEYNPFETPNMAGDIEKAKELMAQAGYPDGFDGPLNFVGASDPPHDRYAESVRADLEELGFTNLKVKTPAFPNQYTQFYQVTDSETAIGTSAGWCKDYPDAFTYFDPLWNGKNISTEGSNQVYSEVDDPELNAAIDEAAATEPGPERDAAWEEVNRMATENASWIPWTWDDETIVYSEGIQNVFYNQACCSHIDWPSVALEDTGS
jgi:peptide/nickel transport system substrate-binding protein